MSRTIESVDRMGVILKLSVFVRAKSEMDFAVRCETYADAMILEMTRLISLSLLHREMCGALQHPARG
jgi:hypothetical protein